MKFKKYNEARKSDTAKLEHYSEDGEFKLNENKPTRKMSHNQFNAFVEGIDFKISPTGKIQKL